MLPSRGLRPVQYAALSSRQLSLVRSNASRQFSSIPRTVVRGAPSSRANSLQSAGWRASPSNVLLSASSVRYGSWYAPWSWGRSSSPADATPPMPSQIVSESPLAAEPVVTSATPELAPAGIDKPPVLESASATSETKSIEDLLNLDPTSSVADATAVTDATAAITYWGQLKDLGLDYGWGPSAFFESLVELCYIHTGFGWAAAIGLSTLALRIVLFTVFQRPGSDSMAKVAAVNPLLKPLMAEMQEAKAAGDDAKYQNLKLRQQYIMKDVGAEIFKPFGVMAAQMAFGFGAFRSLRGMSTLPAPGMTTEGWLWFTDLTVSDPYYILPLMSGGLMYVIMKMGGETGVSTTSGTLTDTQKGMTKIFPPLMTLITAWQPAAIQLYFICTSALGGITAYSLRQPAVRRFLRITPLPTPESNELYGNAIKNGLTLKKIRDPAGNVRYQAPNTLSPMSKRAPRNPRTTRTLTTASDTPSPTLAPDSVVPGINLKPGTELPFHLRPKAKTAVQQDVPKEYRDRDFDYDAGIPRGFQPRHQWDWIRRNYRWRYVINRLSVWGDQLNPKQRAERDRKERERLAAEKYERERKRRLQAKR